MQIHLGRFHHGLQCAKFACVTRTMLGMCVCGQVFAWWYLLWNHILLLARESYHTFHTELCLPQAAVREDYREPGEKIPLGHRSALIPDQPYRITLRTVPRHKRARIRFKNRSWIYHVDIIEVQEMRTWSLNRGWCAGLQWLHVKADLSTHPENEH